MGSVGSSGMTFLTQLLSSSGSPLLSGGMSSSQVQSVLLDAPTTDLVQLSDQAIQLQNIDSLFGIPSTSQSSGLFPDTSASNSGAMLDGLLTSLATESGSTSGTNVSSSQSASSSGASALAGQIAGYQSQLQAEQLQSLFGMGSTNDSSGISLDSIL